MPLSLCRSGLLNCFFNRYVRSTNASYGVPVIELLPLPTGGQDLYSSNAFVFEPVNTLSSTRQHCNLSLLNTFTFVPTTNDTQYVTDCDHMNLSDVARLAAR